MRDVTSPTASSGGQQSAKPCSALFLGAHADDIEIGCGGTLAKMVALGWDVWMCVVTDDADRMLATTRRHEAQASAAAYGVPAAQVLFLGAPDTQLRCDGETVGALRRLLGEAHCDPDLVITHTAADSHNDHRTTHDLSRATFRHKPFLCFGVVNSFVPSAFVPKVFVDVVGYTDVQAAALARHATQHSRINVEAIQRLRRTYAHPIELEQVEPFEVLLQHGAEDLAYVALSLNDCAFHGFWYPLIQEQGLTNLYSVPVYRQTMASRWSPSKEREGAAQLFAAFTQRWHDRNPLQEHPNDGPAAEQTLRTANCLLSGGAASNGLIQTWFNHFEGLRYVTEYSMPGYTRHRIVDRRDGTAVQATYTPPAAFGRMVTTDVGILTVMRNPMHPGRSLVGCMGIHGFGTYACLRVLSEARFLAQLPATSGFQIFWHYEVPTDEICLLQDSLHLVSSTG